MKIGYMSDPVPEYSAAIGKADSLESLKSVLLQYSLLCEDAIDQVSAMTEYEWLEFRKGLAQERRGKFAGESWMHKYGAILMPEIMLRVSMIAERFGAPWGCAYIRYRDEGYITEENGFAKWTGPKP